LAGPRPIALVPENAEIAAMRAEAIGVLVELEKRFPHMPDVLSSVGSLYSLYALDNEARVRWERSIRLAPKSAAPYDAMGCAAVIRGDYDEAIRMLRKAVQLDPRRPRSQLILGEALTNAGQMEQAVVELKQFVNNHPDAAEGFFRLGQAYLHLKDYDQARKAHERAIRLNPKLAAAYHALASVCESLGQREQAEQYRQAFARLNRGQPGTETKTRGGVNDIDLGRSNLAEAHLVAARTYLAMAGTHGSRNLVGDAERHLRAAARADPTNRESRVTLVGMYDKSKRYREAAELLAELEQVEPEDLVHRINRGTLLVRIGDFAAAEQEFVQAMAIAPQEPDGYAKLGWLRLLTKTNLPEARELAKSAIRLQPKDASHHWLLSQICEAQGHRSAALEAIERAIELDPTNPRLQQQKAKLDVQREP
jgi:tetratricopeptide (TPR) repeat protein